MLFFLVVFGVGIIQSFFTPEKTPAFLSLKSELAGNVFAPRLGIVTPFCSCSAVPLFVCFVTAGVPLQLPGGGCGVGQMTTGESLLPATYEQELKDRSQMKIGPRFFKILAALAGLAALLH